MSSQPQACDVTAAQRAATLRDAERHDRARRVAAASSTAKDLVVRYGPATTRKAQISVVLAVTLAVAGIAGFFAGLAAAQIYKVAGAALSAVSIPVALFGPPLSISAWGRRHRVRVAAAELLADGCSEETVVEALVRTDGDPRATLRLFAELTAQLT